MKRLFFSLVLIFFASLATTHFSSAFFSDTEQSNENVLAAGSIDLSVSNTSYYRGQISQDTTWQTSGIGNELFLNFADIKPQDWGEDTIGLSVNDNPSWVCGQIELTADDDSSCNTPELADDPACSEPNNDPFDGELGDNLGFIFWVDDGDSVLENNEYQNQLISEGQASQVLDSSWALADSENNLLGGSPGDGVEPGREYYIGKAWCFGQLTPEPLPQSDGLTPANSTGGISCDGSFLDNSTQTDILTADFEFSAHQKRHNLQFLCENKDILWQIGDIESSQTQNPVDELNWPGGFGVFLDFPDPFEIGTNTDSEFPWNSNYNANYAREINIDFDYSGSLPTDVRLILSWSPGTSGTEAKEVLLNGTSIYTTGDVSGQSVSGWWNNMPVRGETIDLQLTQPTNTITLKHTKGNGTLWDYILLKKI